MPTSMWAFLCVYKYRHNYLKVDFISMTWYYNGSPVEEVPEDAIGFVYIIHNLTNGRMYIGKKLFTFSKTTYKTVTLKNNTKKKKKVKTRNESDWRSYYGSNLELKKDVETLGTENFRREIMFFCKSKAECSYIEAREQFSRKVLESDDYYNAWISVKCHQAHIIGKIF